MGSSARTEPFGTVCFGLGCPFGTVGRDLVNSIFGAALTLGTDLAFAPFFEVMPLFEVVPVGMALEGTDYRMVRLPRPRALSRAFGRSVRHADWSIERKWAFLLALRIFFAEVKFSSHTIFHRPTLCRFRMHPGGAVGLVNTSANCLSEFTHRVLIPVALICCLVAEISMDVLLSDPESPNPHDSLLSSAS